MILRDHLKGATAYSIHNNEAQIQTEIMTNGPVEGILEKDQINQFFFKFTKKSIVFSRIHCLRRFPKL